MNDLIKTVKITPSEVFIPNGLDPILKEIDSAVSSLVPDISNEKGRKEIASLCYKIKRSKTYLDDIGKEYVSKLKEQPKIVDAERKRVRDYLDGLEEKIRRPLTEWEEAEEKRKADIMFRINMIDPFEGGIKTITIDDYSLEGFNALLVKAEKFIVNDSLAEFMNLASKTKEDVILKLQGLIAKKTKFIEEQAELDRLRKEAAEREQKEREQRIAQEAADKARREAEEKIKAEAQAAEQAKLRAEAQARAAEEREKLAKDQAEAQAKAAAQRERERIEAEQRAEAEAAKKREENQKHRAKINNQAVSGLLKIGLTDELAKSVVTAIAKNEIPNISISY